MFSKLIGILLLILGLALLIWIGYNLLIEMQPEAEGRNPLVAFALGVAMVITGIIKMRGKKKSE